MDAKDRLKKQDAQRYALLRAVYDTSGGRMDHGIDLDTIAESLNIPPDEAANAKQFLLGKGLLWQRTMFSYSLTHRGLVEVEESIRSPNAATEHFQPTTILNFHGSVGAVQTASHSVAHVTQNILNDNSVKTLIQQLHQHAEEAAPEIREEAKELVKSLEEQVASGSPNRAKFKAFLGGLKDLLTNPLSVAVLGELAKKVLGT